MRSKIAKIRLACFLVFGCLSLLAAGTRVDLADEDYRIAAGEWKWVEVDLRQQPATVIASYEVHGGAGNVRIALLSRDDLDPLQEKAILAGTALGPAGAFAYRIRYRDNYAILVDNRADKANAVSVRLRVSLDFASPRVTQLSRERQATVIGISFLTFFAVVTYSARKLLKAARG